MYFCPLCSNLLLVEAGVRRALLPLTRAPTLLTRALTLLTLLLVVLLVIDRSQGTCKFFCQTCPYVYRIREPVSVIA
jgi:hypothetical protein